MSSRTRQSALSLLGLLVISVLSASVVAQQNPLPQNALRAFEAIRAAETAGADITSLLAEYNSLLQQPSNSSLDQIRSEAASAEKVALGQASLWRTLTVLFVPVTALLLTACFEGVRFLKRRVARERRLDQEVIPI